MADDAAANSRRRVDPRAVVSATLVLTLGLVAAAFLTVDRAVEQAVDDRFARLVSDVTTQLDERLTIVETAVVATRGLLDGSEDVTDVELSRFADALSLGRPLAERFPGLAGLVVVDADGGVVFTAPANDRIGGLATAALTEPATATALDRATDLALPATTVVDLPDESAALVVTTPRYADPAAEAPTATTDLRRGTVIGHTVGIVDLQTLLRGVVPAPATTVASLETSDGTVLQTVGDLGVAPVVRERVVVLSQLGRGDQSLRLHVEAASGALGGTDRAPLLVLLLGIPLALVLSALVWLLATQRERALAQVEAATAALARSNQELEQSNAQLRDFAGVVAHDLRGPLASIQGLAHLLDMLVGDELRPREADIVDRIQETTAAMGELIGDVLRFAEAGVAPIDLETVELSALTEEVLARIEASVGARDTIVVDVEGTVRVDPTGVRRVLANLVGNAVKHGRRDGPVTVTVRSRRVDDRVVVEVTDDGPGIPADQRAHVLEPFQRGATSARGSGLGLAISTRIVTHHDGTLELDDAPGGGTVVRFDLPAA